MRYALEAWTITRELSEWKNQDSYNVTRKCFKSLSQFCTEAIKRGNFETSTLEIYIERYMKYKTQLVSLFSVLSYKVIDKTKEPCIRFNAELGNL